MAKEQPVEFIKPPNTLKAKLGSAVAHMDMDAVERAEQAIMELKAEFPAWIDADVARLSATRDSFAQAHEAARRDDLYRAAHDLEARARRYCETQTSKDR
jgi:predicted Zn-dependent protease